MNVNQMPQEPVAEPKRPAHLPHGRWLGDFEPLSVFEDRLVKACARGEVCKPDNWDVKRPEADAATESNTIRAQIIRFLALGGDSEHPVHETGVMLKGGWIKDVLSLHQASATVRLDLRYCHFENAPVFIAARMPELVLSGSKSPGLSADRMIAIGSVFLNDGFEANGEVRLLGALIGGELACTNGKFYNPEANALSADQIVVKGSLFLSDGFEARGQVRLSGALVAGSMDCESGKFNNPGKKALIAENIVVKGSMHLRRNFEASGEVRMIGAHIGGSLSCINGSFNNPGGRALSADRMVVTGSLFLRNANKNGTINLSAARIGTLADDIACWQAGGHILDGLYFDRIIGATDAASRIGWLETQRKAHLTSDFRPQPWEHLIKTLREMGHPYEAAQVAIAKQKQLRKAGKIEGPARKTLHWLYGFLADYGYEPFKLVQWMTCLWLACAFFFSVGGSYGYIGPGTPLLNNPELAASIDENCGHRREGPKQVWTQCAAMPAEYTTFQPLLYSLDLILPLVDLQQDSDWTPIVEEAPGVNMGYGVFLRWLMWFEILFGWVASLMLVAILGRLVEKD